MTKTITANIPAIKSYQAHTLTYTQDDAGNWTGGLFGGRVLESDVIDACKKASNWAAIRAEHFPMVGFTA